MGGGQQGHQVFHAILHSPIPNWVPDIGAIMDGMKPAFQAGIESVVNLSTFIANGFQGTQSVQIKNLGFDLNHAPDDNIPYWHVDIIWDVDIVTDIDWITIAVAISVVGGAITIIAGIVTANPALIFLGGLLIFSAVLLNITEVVHEVLGGGGNIIGFLTSPIGLVLIGVTAGYFLWTASGRGFVKTSAQRAAPYVKRGASEAGRRLKRATKRGNGGKSAFEELGGL